MPQEIERKFLVDTTAWRPDGPGRRFRQAYLMTAPDRSLRIRLEDGVGAKLTFKAGAGVLERSEFDYAIPAEDAAHMIDIAEGRVIDKVRHDVDVEGTMFEVDVFGGDLAGLVLAEVELPAVDARFPRPRWLGREVTEDRRYLNATLARDGLPADHDQG